MHPVVDDVACDEQTHFGHMQHRGRVGVGVTDLDWNERDTVELETALVDDGHLQLAGGYLSGEHPIPEVGTELWIVLRLHQFGSSFRRCHGDAREPLQQRNCAEPMVPVTVGDVYLPQFASRRHDPITDLGRLRCCERRIDQYGVMSSHDQRGGYR